MIRASIRPYEHPYALRHIRPYSLRPYALRPYALRPMPCHDVATLLAYHLVACLIYCISLSSLL